MTRTYQTEMATYWTILTVDRVELAALSDCGVNHYYSADNIRHRNVPVLVSYCRDCLNFVLSEHIYSSDQIDAKIEYLRILFNNNPNRSGNFEESCADYIEMHRDLCRLLLDRTSLPRCLECGSTQIDQEQVDSIGNPIGCLTQRDVHPEVLTVEWDSPFEELVLTPINRFYNLEGMEIKSPCEDHQPPGNGVGN